MHSRGPWKIGYGGMEGDDFAVITSPHRERAICELKPRDYDFANAILIAHAPQLLDALRDLINAVDGNGNLIDAVEGARVAVRKATDETFISTF